MRKNTIIKNIIIFFSTVIFGLVKFNNICTPHNRVDNYNIILISIDTLRADHLGCYGYFRNTSPNIDRLAKEGLLFKQAISQGCWTISSHASIFTSQYQAVHGMGADKNRLDDIKITLAEILKNAGYKTAAFVDGPHLGHIFNFNQGFEEYHTSSSITKKKDINLYSKRVLPLVLKWLNKNKNQKFFLFLHNYEVHAPYHSPFPYEHMYDAAYKGICDTLRLTPNFIENVKKGGMLILYDKKVKLLKLSPADISHIIAHYDSQINYVDNCLGMLFDKLSKLSLLNKTIIIITSDHGEQLMDHGRLGHMGSDFAYYYDEVIRVPLIIRHPGFLGLGNKKISNLVQSINIMPTVLDFLNIPIPKTVQGQTLVPFFEGEYLSKFNEFAYSGTGVIRTSKWKLIYEEGSNENALYDLENDPGESINLYEKQPEILTELKTRLQEWQKNNEALKDFELSYSVKNIELPTDIKKELKKLGYW